MNPAPDADVQSVGQENFDWIVNAVAELAVKKALSDENPAQDLRWSAFLRGSELGVPQKRTVKSATKSKSSPQAQAASS
jgi:hypothetical protein